MPTSLAARFDHIVLTAIPRGGAAIG